MENLSINTLFGLLAGLLFLSACFSASETAMMAINRYRLRHSAETGHRGAILGQVVQVQLKSVGTALARNPFPLVIPCHRAVREGGAIGGFRGGVGMKRRLLELEGIVFAADGRVAMGRIHCQYRAAPPRPDRRGAVLRRQERT